MLIYHSWQNVSTFCTVDLKRAEPGRRPIHYIFVSITTISTDTDAIRHALTHLRKRNDAFFQKISDRQFLIFENVSLPTPTFCVLLYLCRTSNHTFSFFTTNRITVVQFQFTIQNFYKFLPLISLIKLIIERQTKKRKQYGTGSSRLPTSCVQLYLCRIRNYVHLCFC